MNESTKLVQHTPGPWHKDDSNCGGFNLIADNGDWIATIHCGREDDEKDARLIAAAPDLLAACEFAESLLCEAQEGNTHTNIAVGLQQLAEAIAKARGIK